MTVTINDVSYDHGSLTFEAVVAGNSSGQLQAFSDVSYEDGVERTKQRGAERIAQQATEGQYDATGSVTMFRNMYDAVVAWFRDENLSWYETEFQITVQYWNKGDAAHEDVIPRVKWQKRSFSSSEGTDPNKVTCELFILGTIFFDGVDGYNNRLDQ